MIFSLIINKIKLRLCSLILLSGYTYGTLLENVYNFKTNQNRVEFLKSNVYAVYSDRSSAHTSNLGCLNRCIALANGYSTVCAGITLRRDETSTVCTMLYTNDDGVPDLPRMKGADIIGRGGNAYWYHPQIGKIIYSNHPRLLTTKIFTVNNPGEREYCPFGVSTNRQNWQYQYQSVSYVKTKLNLSISNCYLQWWLNCWSLPFWSYTLLSELTWHVIFRGYLNKLVLMHHLILGL